jgi:hypothetical protein
MICRQSSHIAAAAGAISRSANRLPPRPQIEFSGDGPAGPIGRPIDEGSHIFASAFNDHVLGTTALDQNLTTLIDASSLTVFILQGQVHRPDSIGKPTQRKIDSALDAVVCFVCECESLGQDA